MSEPKRYMSDVCNLGPKGYSCLLIQHKEGEFVRYEDYARLKAEVEWLTKAGDAMASSIQFNEEMAKDYNGPTIVHQSVQRWNAAKEGKSQP